jgi:hypothetical protein
LKNLSHEAAMEVLRNAQDKVILFSIHIFINIHNICIPITINNLFKACFSKKYPAKIQSLNLKTGVYRILKIVCLKNPLPITFGTTFMCIKVLKVRNQIPHTRISNL